MGEASVTICPQCGREGSAEAGGRSGLACFCGAPIALAVVCPGRADDPQKAYDPGDAVPPAIKAGLIEIYASIKEERNPKGGLALCWDVLDLILDYGRQTWPPKAAGPTFAPPLSLEAEALTTLVISGLTGVLFVRLGGALGWGGDLAPAACGLWASPCASMMSALVSLLIGLLTGAVVSVLVLRMLRAAPPRPEPPARAADHDHGEAPSRTSRLKVLRERGVISAELYAWGAEIGLDDPPRDHHGDVHAPRIPQPPATTDGVRRLGSFVLTLADQVFQRSIRVSDARTGRWP